MCLCTITCLKQVIYFPIPWININCFAYIKQNNVIYQVLLNEKIFYANLQIYVCGGWGGAGSNVMDLHAIKPSSHHSLLAS